MVRWTEGVMTMAKDDGDGDGGREGNKEREEIQSIHSLRTFFFSKKLVMTILGSRS